MPILSNDVKLFAGPIRGGDTSEVNIQLVVPMAGRGTRFLEKGFPLPKPLIDVYGKPMFLRVTENLKSPLIKKKIFITLKEHETSHGLTAQIEKVPLCHTVILNEITEGAACTVCLAAPLLDMDLPLVIANSDQILAIDSDKFFGFCESSGADGVIMTMTASTSEWSYVKTDDRGEVIEVAEKKVISDEATVGVYHFRHAHLFFTAAEQMFARNDRVNGEFYVAPVYNYLIKSGASVVTFNIGDVHQQMFSLGTPEHLEKCLSNPLFKKSIDAD